MAHLRTTTQPVEPPGIFIWGGGVAQESEDRSSLVGSRGEALEVGLGDESQKLKQSADIVYRLLLQKPPKFETVGLINTLILKQSVSR